MDSKLILKEISRLIELSYKNEQRGPSESETYHAQRLALADLYVWITRLKNNPPTKKPKH